MRWTRLQLYNLANPNPLWGTFLRESARVLFWWKHFMIFKNPRNKEQVVEKGWFLKTDGYLFTLHFDAKM